MHELAQLARRLRDEAQASRQRRLLVLHGTRRAGFQAAATVLEAAGIDPSQSLLVGPKPIEGLGLPRLGFERSREVMGTTKAALVLDAHESFDPDVLGRTVGAVDGGGLYLLLTPPLETWPEQRGAFDRGLAVPPFATEDVAGRFRTRLVALSREHPGVAIVDVDEDNVEQRGLTDAPTDAPTDASKAPTASPRVAKGDERRDLEPPERTTFPDAVYEACLTRDQRDTVHALEALLDPGQILTVEADRGRGKSSAAGLAVGGLLARGADVLLTAPRRSNVDEVFAHARDIAEKLDLAPREAAGGHRLDAEARGGSLVHQPPLEALASAEEADAIVVDEAAGLPVHVLEGFLTHRTPVGFATTIHGYEGAGRGFSVRLQDRLDETSRPVHRVEMEQPIRYAADDPLEAWSFQALLLDAAPAPGEAIPEAQPRQATYRAPSPEELLEDEALLREAFGLLVLAHYRTTPADLARLLDAPNVGLHCITLENHVVSVALVAREGGLPEALRERMYEGQRVPGNLIPDVLTSQLRDEQAAIPRGWRILRIATHPEHRRRGFGTRLLQAIEEQAREQAESGIDWLGTSYGATPGLLSFWHRQGYRTVHLSASRNPTSGEHSALQLHPLTEAGRELADRSEAWLVRRLPSVLADALGELDPDVVRAALAGLEQAPTAELEAIEDREWLLVAAAAYGPGVYDIAPRPFRCLALHHLVDQRVELDGDAERLLVCKVLQARPWENVREELGYASKRMAMRALGEAYQPLVDAYGPEAAQREADRFSR